LAQTYDVTLLCLSDQPRREETTVAPGFVQVAIPKAAAHRQLERTINRMFPVPASDIVSALECLDNPALTETFQRLAADASVIVCTHPYLSPLLALLPSSARLIYEAHNIELQIKRGMLAGHPLFPELMEVVSEIEGFACRTADAVISVSAEDTPVLAALSAEKIRLVRNGTSLATRPSRTNPVTEARRCRSAVFLGSGHAPNVEAAKFLIDEVAPRLPDVTFRIAGMVCHAIAGKPHPPNVVLFHFLEETEKNDLMASTEVGLNPVFAGGGSSLKIADYFAAGLPVLSTRVGIRGYDLVDGQHVVVAEADCFASRLQELLANAPLRSTLAAAAQAYARQFLDWNILAGDFLRIVEEVRR
jgi:glycosyltransferase involved in cell wall biosynthesis